MILLEDEAKQKARLEAQKKSDVFSLLPQSIREKVVALRLAKQSGISYTELVNMPLHRFYNMLIVADINISD